MVNSNEPVVAEVLSDTELVISIGSDMGVKEGQRFLIYSVSEHELFDPETFVSLGKFENAKGIGKATQVQEKTTVIQWDTDQSNPAKKESRQNNWLQDIQEENLANMKAFKEPVIGDKVKRI